MSSLKVYDLPDLVSVEKDDCNCNVVIPGALVRHKNDDQSLGIAISRAWGPNDRPMQVAVVWSIEPNTFPRPRRVQQSLIANDIVSIQPMSLPAGLVFYLDYTYGSGSKGEV